MPQSLTTSDIDELDLVHQDYIAAYNRGDAAGVASLFTRDGQLFPAFTGMVFNHEAIQAFWQGIMDLGIRSVSLETQETEVLSETCLEVGKYTMMGWKDQVLDIGKYIMIWKIETGSWRIHRYIWTTSLPPPGPSPGTD
jgi:uncharacterized protein (TIGR02246 family)